MTRVQTDYKLGQIVYISIGMTSTLEPGLELCRRLSESGHRITCLSHADIGHRVRLSEFPFIRLTSDEECVRSLSRDPMPRWLLRNVPRLLQWINRRRRIRSQSLHNHEIEEALKPLAPDLLLIDIECHFAVIASARLNIPTALIMFWFSPFKAPGFPPMETRLLPGKTWRQRLLISAAWWWSHLGNLARDWRFPLSPQGLANWLRVVRYTTVDYPDLRALASTRNYPLGAETDRFQWLRPYLYRNLPILSFNLWEMEFPHTPHPNLHYVGPMINPHRPVRDLVSASVWNAFKLAADQWGDQHRSVIYCSLGSFWTADPGFLRRLIQVFERRQDWVLVLGLGGKLKGADLAPIPQNAVVLDWAPQIEVLQRADCAITHAGISTINECIYCGVPMVVYSTKHVDQNGCAARIAYHGLGIVADKDRDASRQIEQNIERALSDPALLANVQVMRARLTAYEQENTALKVLTEVMASSPTNH